VDEPHRRVAAKIRALARSRKIPLSHVADRAGASRTYLFDVLAGRSSPTLAWLVRIAEVLGVDVAELLARKR
jgi:transcriptional regulator with XRE-family HTH domain